MRTLVFFLSPLVFEYSHERIAKKSVPPVSLPIASARGVLLHTSYM